MRSTLGGDSLSSKKCSRTFCVLSPTDTRLALGLNAPSQCAAEAVAFRFSRYQSTAREKHEPSNFKDSLYFLG